MHGIFEETPGFSLTWAVTTMFAPFLLGFTFPNSWGFAGKGRGAPKGKFTDSWGNHIRLVNFLLEVIAKTAFLIAYSSSLKTILRRVRGIIAESFLLVFLVGLRCWGGRNPRR